MFISILKLVHDPINCPLCGQHALTMSLTGQNYNHPSSISAMRMWASWVQSVHTTEECKHLIVPTAWHSQWHNGREFKIFWSPFIKPIHADAKLLRFDSLKFKEIDPNKVRKEVACSIFWLRSLVCLDINMSRQDTDSCDQTSTMPWRTDKKCSYDYNFTALVVTPLDPPPPSPTAAPLTTTANNYGQNNNKVHILQPQQIFLTLQIFLRVSPV